jgi:hypothetical protein
MPIVKDKNLPDRDKRTRPDIGKQWGPLDEQWAALDEEPDKETDSGEDTPKDKK